MGTPAEDRLQALDDWAVETAMRMSALEYVLELLVADAFAATTAEAAADYIAAAANPMKPAWTFQDGVTPESMRAATERITRHVENLLEKAEARAALRREARPPRSRKPG